MAQPRRVLPGRTYLLTRRCFDRQYLLRPSPMVDQILRYALAFAARRFGIEVHLFVFLSNHYHMVVTDVLGQLPRFCHWLHKIVARFLNAHYGRFECFWAPGSYSAVHLVDAEAVLDKCAYLLANPVAAGLVNRGVAWPGWISAARDMLPDAPAFEAKRPKFYFSPRTKLPEEVALKLTCPPALRDRDPEEVVGEIERRREALEEAARSKVQRRGIPFLGRKKLLTQHPFERPSTREPRWQLSPNVACRDRWKRIEQLQELREFRLEYRECYVEFRNGNRSVVFPEGTWGPVELYGARAKGAPRPRPRPIAG